MSKQDDKLQETSMKLLGGNFVLIIIFLIVTVTVQGSITLVGSVLALGILLNSMALLVFGYAINELMANSIAHREDLDKRITELEDKENKS